MGGRVNRQCGRGMCKVCECVRVHVFVKEGMGEGEKISSKGYERFNSRRRQE